MKAPSASVSLHQAAMERTQEAVLAQDPRRSRELFCQALDLERRAAEIWMETRNEEPTRSILLRSAASLAWSCQDYVEAERLARKGLEGKPPGKVVRELEELLERSRQRNLYLTSDPEDLVHLDWSGEWRP
jgi:hypothetical protein